VPYQNILVKKSEGLGWVVLNRPERLNAEGARAFLEKRKPDWSGR
jgi:enoyl-CoA hydratase/carnithine racemase